MMQYFKGWCAAAVLVLGGLSLAGCAAPDDGKVSYPTTPPASKNQQSMGMSGNMNGMQMQTPANSAAMRVPKEAVELSHGDYPPPAFPTPDKPGLILVVDMDGDPDTAVASTAVTGQDAGKMMSITDIANMSVTMNKLHKFKIVFVPTNPGTTP